MRELEKTKDTLHNVIEGVNKWSATGKTMTVREVANVFGCDPETVKKHIRELYPDLMKNGVTTYLTETQITVILESIKKTTAEHRGKESVNLQRSVVGIDTSKSRVLRLQVLYKQVQDIYEAEIAELQAKVEEDKPKVEFYDTVADSKDAITMCQVAKVLNMGIGRNKIFAFLRNQKVLMTNNIPYQKYMDKNYFRVIEQEYRKDDGSVRINLVTLVYQEGLDYIRKLLNQYYKEKAS